MEIRMRDHVGLEHVVTSVADVNRLIDVLNARRDHLAELMLGSDRQAAIAAETLSDDLEDRTVPAFQAELARVVELLGDERRRAKARAIKARGTAS